MKAIIALFCLVAFVSAETLGAARMRDTEVTESAFLEAQETPFGKSLMSMLSVKYQTAGGKLQVIINLLDQLAGNINAQQKKEDEEFNKQITAWKDLIARKEKEIAAAEAEIKKLLAEQKRLKAELADKRARLATNEKNLADTRAQLAKITEIRKAEHAQYVEHMEQQKAIQAGIKAVVEIISGLFKNTEVDQKDLKYITDQLADLKEEFEKSIKQETEEENRSQENYEETKKAMEASIAALVKRIAALKRRIAEIVKRLAEIVVELAQQEAIIVAAKKVIAHTQEEIKTLTAQYDHNKLIRTAQLKLIAKVKGVFTANPKDVQAYLNKA